MTTLTRRTVLALAAAGMIASVAGCDIIEDATTLTIPVSYEIPQTVPIAYPGSERLSQLQNESADVYPIVNYLPIDLQDVHSQIPGADAVREVRVVAIRMNIESNTLDTSLQEFDFRVGEPGTQLLGQEVGGSDWDSALSIGVTDVQPAGMTGVVNANMVAENLSTAGQQIADLSFGFGIGTSLVIPEGNIPEGGVANVRFTLDLEFLIRPLN